jgi:hypothetical protein
MQAPVGDSYAAQLTAGIYQRLASAPVPDPLLAISQTRREVEDARAQQPAGAPRRGRAEWATPALWVRGLRLPLYHRSEPFGPVAETTAPVFAEGMVVCKVGEFVGRRSELRIARRTIASDKAGLIIHAIGGVGKSTLAAEIATAATGRLLVVSLRGPLAVDDILKEVGERLTLMLPASREDLTRPIQAPDHLTTSLRPTRCPTTSRPPASRPAVASRDRQAHLAAPWP